MIALLLALMGTGVMLTVLLAAMGAFMFGVNSLVQAWALDIADGRKLEGTMMGAMYGTNMIFQGFAPLLVGVIVASFGFGALFWYVATMNGVGVLLIALLLPVITRGTKQRVTQP